MSKWCGDENCLQCADKEPDPYVHLPRADYEALREQNRVLRLEFQSLLNAIDDSYDEDLPVEIVEARNKAQAALTATSQPGGTHEL